MKSKLLEIENLAIGFKELICKEVSANVYSGTLTALMGINGAGKSCLLKTLGRLIPLKSGIISLNGKLISEYEAIDFSKIVSLVLTEKIQVDFLRVDELVSLGRSPFTNWSGELSPIDKDIVKQVMDQVGILNLANSFFSELSDGQKQKVLLARALAQKPELLILDEPTTYLDIPSKIELLSLLKKIVRENNVAVIMSTHDLEIVKVYADQVWLMGNDGSFTSDGPESMESSGLFEKHFFYKKN